MIEEVLFNPDDKTKVTLLFSNTATEDILLKDDLDKLAQKYPDRFKVHYTVSKLGDKKEKTSWKGDIGYFENLAICLLMHFWYLDTLQLIC